MNKGYTARGNATLHERYHYCFSYQNQYRTKTNKMCHRSPRDKTQILHLQRFRR